MRMTNVLFHRPLFSKDFGSTSRNFITLLQLVDLSTNPDIAALLRAETGELMLDRCGIMTVNNIETLSCCLECWQDLSKGRVSNLSLKRGFNLGCPFTFPIQLPNLTLTEERIIALNYACGAIVKFTKAQ